MPAVASMLIVLTPSWLMSAPGARNPAGSAVPLRPSMSIAPPMPLMSFPETIQLARSPRADTCMPPCRAEYGRADDFEC